MPALEARELYRFFHVGEEETVALRGVSLTLRSGEILAVTGPSGSGKSTLLGCLAGLDEPDGGAVFLSGERMSHRTESRRAQMRSRQIGVLFQSANLLPHLSVEANVALAQRITRTVGRPAEVIASVGLGHRARALPSQLSGGEAARAGLAVAVANDPPVLLADEPTGEVDGATERRVLALLRMQADRGRAVLVVTHSMNVVGLADRVLSLDEGRVA